MILRHGLDCWGVAGDERPGQLLRPHFCSARHLYNHLSANVVLAMVRPAGQLCLFYSMCKFHLVAQGFSVTAFLSHVRLSLGINRLLAIGTCKTGKPCDHVRAIAFACILLCTQALLPAEIKDPESLAALRSIALEHEANSERLRTWRGAIRITTDSVIQRNQDGAAEPVKVESDATVNFVWDRLKKAFRANYATQKNTMSGIDEGRLKDNESLIKAPHCCVMVVDDAYYSCLFDTGVDFRIQKDTGRSMPVGRVAVVRAAAERPKPQR